MVDHAQIKHEPGVGADIRALRKSRHIRLNDLATALNRSSGWLSQIERGQTEPAISDLRNIADYFEMPISFFFRNDEAPAHEKGLVVRKAARMSLGSKMDGLTEQLLSPHLSGEFEMLRSEFAPGAKSDWVAARPTQEGGYIMTGALELYLGDKTLHLFEGDSFQFQNETYRWTNPGCEPAIILWVIAPPIY